MILSSRSAVLLLGVALTALPRVVRAQNAPPLEISAVYTYVRDPTVDITFPRGWGVGVAMQLHGWLSLVGEYDESRKTISTIAGDLRLGIRTASAGGRVSGKLGRAREFGQLQLGLVHSSGGAFGASEADTHVCAQAGAGIDVPVARRVSLRAELDYRMFLDHRGFDLGRQFRALSGVVFKVF